jgi:hypothetical protein
MSRRPKHKKELRRVLPVQPRQQRLVRPAPRRKLPTQYRRS